MVDLLGFYNKPTQTVEYKVGLFLFSLVVPIIDIGKQCDKKRSEENEQEIENSHNKG